MMRVIDRFTMREPLLVLMLAVLAFLFFAVTHAYTAAYDNRRAELGAEWYGRGLRDLQAGRSGAAVDEFRTALLYAPGNWDYRVRLAEALGVGKHTTEALGYYRSLWQNNPSDGAVNLELARLAVKSGDRQGAERYFNGAIFGTWKADAAANRREALFEMIDFYLAHNDFGSADSQLMVLASNLPSDSQLHAEVAERFERANDPAHALEQFGQALAQDRDNIDALRGAAAAASRLADDRDARMFLERIVHLVPSDNDAHQRLDTIKELQALDPFLPRIGAAERARRVLRGFQLAGDRLTACGNQLHLDFSSPDDHPLAALYKRWTELKPSVKQVQLQRDADLTEQIIDLVFQLEKQTNRFCGAPAPGPDLALLTLAQRRPGVPQ
jgi:tetratricopeptide (TPR) repeat protein